MQVSIKKNRHTSESGQALTEYLVLLILIALTSVIVVREVGSKVTQKFREARDKIENVNIGR